MRVLLDGLTFAEGPRWRDAELYFSDLQSCPPEPAGRVGAVDEGGALRTVVDRVPGGPPSGLGWLPDGRLLLVATAARRLLASNPFLPGGRDPA